MTNDKRIYSVTAEEKEGFVPGNEEELRLYHEVVCAVLTCESADALDAAMCGAGHVIRMRRLRARMPPKDPYRSSP